MVGLEEGLYVIEVTRDGESWARGSGTCGRGWDALGDVGSTQREGRAGGEE